MTRLSIMPRKYFLWLLLVALAVVGVVIFRSVAVTSRKLPTLMTITSFAFANNQVMPVSFTCRGDGHNPPLTISGVPAGAVSLALIMDDPDAPAGDFVHWTVWNIKPSTTQIDEGSAPAQATEGQNSLGQVGYVAPCPPSDTHHYHIKLYALDLKLESNEQSTKDDLLKAMVGHIIDQAEMIGLVTAQK